ncbi:G2 and S phase-expressed protein 1 [Arapaima gigas]
MKVVLRSRAVMASLTSPDFNLLSEEQFDFDVSLSPSSGKEDDEDEVFFGPVGHKKCASVGIDMCMQKDTGGGCSVGKEPSWSPLSGDNFMEIFKEAHLLAKEIERSSNGKQATEEIRATADATEEQEESKEKFVDDPGAKLNVLGKVANPALSPIKRETFCVKNSPVTQLPPAFRRRLLKTSSAPNPIKASASTSSPARVCKAQPKNTLRSKAALTSDKVLPSRPVAPGAAPLQPPGKTRLACTEKGNVVWHWSPHGRHLSSAGSSEDLLSDGASVTSDISDSSFNSSLPLKTGLPPPRKSGLQRPTAMKVHPLQNRRVSERKNTSSSSSSKSSVNSSFSNSPTTKGKFNSSMNSSVNNAQAHGSANTNKRLSSVAAPNPRTSSSLTRAPESGPAARKPTDLQARPAKMTPVRKLQPAASQQTLKPSLERASSVPSVPAAVASVRSLAKPKSFVAPTPRTQSKGLPRSECEECPPPQLTFLAFCTVLVQKAAVQAPDVLRTPGTAQSRARRVSALPTPVNRRISGIPLLTPQSISRSSRVSQVTEREVLPASGRKINHSSPVLKVTGESNTPDSFATEEPSVLPELQPFSLEGEVEENPGILQSSTSAESTADHLETPKHAPQGQELASPVGQQERSHSNKVSTKTPEKDEVLLVDAPPPVLRPEERLLIDLSNTPDFIRTVPTKPSGEQLIDLNSPLITWSPVDKKENTTENAPLINLSF